MRLKPLHAMQGLQWVRQGLGTFRKKPLVLVGLFFLYMGLTSAAQLVPVVGPFLPALLAPFVMLSFHVAVHQELAQENAQMPLILGGVFTACKQQAGTMLLLGVLYAVPFAGILLLSRQFNPELFELYVLGQSYTPDELMALLSTASFQRTFLLVTVLNVVLLLIFWPAPALVHWNGLAPVKSLVFSAVSFVRNLPHFALYLLAWVGLTLLIAPLSAALMGVAGPLAGALLGQLLMALFVTTQHFTYRDCFVDAEDAEDASI